MTDKPDYIKEVMEQSMQLAVKRAVIRVLTDLEPQKRIVLLRELADLFESELAVFGKSK